MRCGPAERMPTCVAPLRTGLCIAAQAVTPPLTRAGWCRSNDPGPGVRCTAATGARTRGSARVLRQRWPRVPVAGSAAGSHGCDDADAQNAVEQRESGIEVNVAALFDRSLPSLAHAAARLFAVAGVEDRKSVV